MRNQTCCFTGHRDCKDSFFLRKRLKSVIAELVVNKGVRFFGAGGALGFDTVASLCVLELKNTYPQIRLILVLPCPEQTKYWSVKDKQVYEYIKRKADKIVYTSEKYTKGCMFKRNRWLVDNSNYCIVYCVKNTGGSYYTVNYAEEKGLEVINSQFRLYNLN
ncbi:MAG: SLOG family protein [Lachnospirales bacterium]